MLEPVRCFCRIVRIAGVVPAVRWALRRPAEPRVREESEESRLAQAWRGDPPRIADAHRLFPGPKAVRRRARFLSLFTRNPVSP